MKFITIEGLDGSGKSTQVKLIRNYFEKNNIKYQYLHFPILDSPFFGEMISKFLRGDLGDNNQVDPYLVAMLYAGDRNNMAAQIRTWLSEGTVVLVDRYVMSNIAYQCAKLNTKEEQETLKNWILDFEYNYYKIPKPDLNIYLDVPFSFTQEQLQAERSGDDRDYLEGKQDIHEADLTFQQKVKNMYDQQTTNPNEINKVLCTDSNGKMLAKELIFDKLITLINNELK
ncbi:MAG: dTMP kinase [Bacteroidales bacterium]|nr:dTMP kinase [Bacteroidales bacterium]